MQILEEKPENILVCFENHLAFMFVTCKNKHHFQCWSYKKNLTIARTQYPQRRWSFSMSSIPVATSVNTSATNNPTNSSVRNGCLQPLLLQSMLSKRTELEKKEPKRSLSLFQLFVMSQNKSKGLGMFHFALSFGKCICQPFVSNPASPPSP